MGGRFHYDRDSLREALFAVGVVPGDIVFCHAGLLKLGLPRELAAGTDAVTLLREVLQEAVGFCGTILTPTFSYSLCKGETFDPATTPSAVGPFGEDLRRQPGAQRSADPIFSVAGLGPQAAPLFAALPHDCFGPDSLYGRLGRTRAKLLLVGVDFEFCTALHHLEQMAGAPHRFLKLFRGPVLRDGRSVREAWLYFVRCLAPECEPRLERAGRILADAGLLRSAPVGLGRILCIDFAAMYAHLRPLLQRTPGLFAAVPDADPLAAEAQRTGVRRFSVDLPPDASMEQLVRGLWRLPRDIVSDGLSAALAALAEQIPLTVRRCRTGTPCFTWLVPEKWTCRRASLETLDGRTLFSYADNPLHVMSYSLPFEGEVDRTTLFAHLHAHPRLPDAIPYVFKYYERDWGLCCTRRQKDALGDARYRVRIDTEFSCGELEVGEWLLPGDSPRCVVLAAHICHPGQAVDDLSGAAVAVELMRRLAARPRRRYSYLLLLGPETIGSASWLAQNEARIPELAGGVFFEMLGAENPHALQHSLWPDSPVDVCAELILRETEPEALVAPFLGVVLNDERMFNAPGVAVPMVSLSRALPLAEGRGHYAAYHSSADTADAVRYDHMEQSLALALGIIDALEADATPRPLFKGEIFCSRYSGIDYASMEEEIFQVMFRLDGRRRVSDIARESGLAFTRVRRTLDILAAEGLVAWD